MGQSLRLRIIPIKKAAFLAVTIVFTAAFVLFWTRFDGSPGINLDAELREGMTEEEVTALFGGPPNEEYGKDIGMWYINFGRFPEGYAYTREWRGEEGIRLVFFDEDHKVLFSRMGAWARPPTLRQRIREFIQSFF